MDFFSFHEQVTKRPNGGTAATAAPPGRPKEKILTVSELTATIEGALEDCLPPVLSARGEVSNFKHHQNSGHLYFTLKDSHACIDCVMYRSDANRLKFDPDDGMELVATGRVGVYAPKGKYQLYVSSLDPVGQGALELKFRQLCKKLEAEALFGQERKRPLPAYPQSVGIVTSTETAALQDMLKVLRKFPWVRVRVLHVPVQGEGAGAKIAAGIAELNRQAQRLGGIDVLLVGRGGGSLEDLWAFNEEAVARAVAGSRIPVVSGIGHEVDVCIADLVADYHAHTPTEAAQVVTAQWRTARQVVEERRVRLGREMRNVVAQARRRVEEVERHPVFRRPLDRVNRARQQLDERQRALAMAVGSRLRGLRDVVHGLQVRLDACHPRHRVNLLRERLTWVSGQLTRGMRHLHERRLLEVQLLAKHLNAVGPEQVLKRGYTLTTRKRGGAVVRSAAELREGERIVTRFADGAVESTVEDGRQMGLFE